MITLSVSQTKSQLRELPAPAHFNSIVVAKISSRDTHFCPYDDYTPTNPYPCTIWTMGSPLLDVRIWKVYLTPTTNFTWQCLALYIWNATCSAVFYLLSATYYLLPSYTLFILVAGPFYWWVWLLLDTSDHWWKWSKESLRLKKNWSMRITQRQQRSKNHNSTCIIGMKINKGHS